jgi:hypothetical protein
VKAIETILATGLIMGVLAIMGLMGYVETLGM